MVQANTSVLKQFWSGRVANLFTVGIVAGLLFAAIRAIGTIGPQAYSFVLPLGFSIMMLMPFIFLKKEGRRGVGLAKKLSSLGSQPQSIFVPGELYRARSARR